MKHQRLLKYCRSILIGVALFSCKPNTWTAEERQSFESSCIRAARMQGLPNAQEYCTCVMHNLETDKSGTPLADLDSAALATLTKPCRDSALAHEAVWPLHVQKVFLSSCLKLAEEKKINNKDRYCQCLLEGIMYTYPGTKDIASINQDSLQKLGKMCEDYYSH
jgi:hypothetical protein